MDNSLRLDTAASKHLANQNLFNIELAYNDIENVRKCLNIFEQSMKNQDGAKALSGLQTLSSALTNLSKNTDPILDAEQKSLLKDLITKIQSKYNELHTIETAIKEKNTKIDFATQFSAYTPFLKDLSNTLDVLTQTVTAFSQNNAISSLPIQKVSQATSQIFWSFNYDQKAVDACMSHNLAALFLGGYAIIKLKISGEEIEGGDPITSCTFIKTLLEEELNGLTRDRLKLEAEAIFPPLIHAMDQIVEAEQQALLCKNSHPNNSAKASKDFASWMQKKISGLPEGESYHFSGGWKGSAQPGHAMLYEITRQKNDKFKMTVYNTGDGLEFHPCMTGENSKHIPFLSQSDIDKETLCNIPEIWCSYYELKYIDAPGFAPYNSSDIYKGFLKGIHSHFGVQNQEKADWSDDLYMTPQEAGTCPVDSVLALIRVKINNYKTYKSLENALKFRVLQKYMRFLENKNVFDPQALMSPELIRERMAILSLLKTNTERLSKNISKALFHSWISKTEGTHANTFLDDVLSKIEKAEKYCQSKYATASPILDLWAVEKLGFKFNSTEAVKASKEGVVKSTKVLDAEAIEWPEKDLKSLPELLQGWIKTARQSPENYDENYLFIQNVFNKMPSIKAAMWGQITIHEIEDCMTSLTELSELYLSSRCSIRTWNNQAIEEICHLQKAFAVVAFLAQRLDPTQTGKLVLDTSYLSHNISDLSAYNGWLLLNNPQLEQELTETLQFFQTLSRGNKGMFSTLTSPSFYKLYNKDLHTSESFEKQMTGLLHSWDDEVAFVYRYIMENPKIKEALISSLKTKNILSPSLHHIVGLALTDLKGEYLPKTFCLLKKQAYLTQIGMRFQASLSRYSNLELVFHKSQLPEDKEFEAIEIKSSSFEIQYPIDRSNFASTRFYVSFSTTVSSNSDKAKLNKNDSSSPLIRLYDKEFKKKQTQNEIELKNFQSEYHVKSIDARYISHLTCHEDKSQQVIKTIKYFKENLSKLDNRDYQLIFESLLFERGVLSSQLKAHPDFAEVLSKFIQESYGLSIFLKKYQKGTFLLRMGNYLTNYCEHENIKYSNPFPDMIKALEGLLKHNLPEQERSLMTRELLAAYARKKDVQLSDFTSVLKHAFYLADHPIPEDPRTQAPDDKNFAPQLDRDVQNLYHKLAIKLNSAQPQARNEVLSEAVGLKTQVSWDFAKFPLLLGDNARYEIDLIEGKLYVEGTETSVLPDWVKYTQPFKAMFSDHSSIKSASIRVQNNVKTIFTDKFGYEYRILKKNGETSSFQIFINDEWCDYVPQSFYEHNIDSTNTLVNSSSCWISPSSKKIHFIDRTSGRIYYEYNPQTGQITCQDKGVREGLALVNNLHYATSWHPLIFFKAFDPASQLWKNNDDKIKIFELPTYGIKFEVVYQDNKCVGIFPTPRQEGFRLSKEQYLPSLRKLPSYIVLEDDDGKKRVLIPRREFKNSTDASQILKYNDKITGKGQDAYYTLHVNAKGRLTGSELAARLYLAYIHVVQRDYQLVHDILFKPHKSQKLSANQLGESAAYSHEELGLLNMIINSGSRSSTDDHDLRATSIRLKAHALNSANMKAYGKTPEANSAITWPEVDPKIIQKDLSRYVTQRSLFPSYALSREEEIQLLVQFKIDPICERRLKVLKNEFINEKNLPSVDIDDTRQYSGAPSLDEWVYSIDKNILDTFSNTIRIDRKQFNEHFYSFYRIAREEPPTSALRKRLAKLMTLAHYDIFGAYRVRPLALWIQSVLSHPEDFPTTFEFCATMVKANKEIKQSYTYLTEDLDVKMIAEIPFRIRNMIIHKLHENLRYGLIDDKNINQLLSSQNSDNAKSKEILRKLLVPKMSAKEFEEYIQKTITTPIMQPLLYCLHKCKDLDDLQLLLSIPPELIKEFPNKRWFENKRIDDFAKNRAVEDILRHLYSPVKSTKEMTSISNRFLALRATDQPALPFIPLKRVTATELPSILFSKQLEGEQNQAEFGIWEKFLKENCDERLKLASIKEAYAKQQSTLEPIARTQADQKITHNEIEAVAKISGEISKLEQAEIQIQSNMALTASAQQLIKLETTAQKPFFVKEKTDPVSDAQEKKIHAELILRLEFAQKGLQDQIEKRKIEALKTDVNYYVNQVRAPQMVLQRTELPRLEKALQDQLDLETAQVSQMKRSLRELANKVPLTPVERAQRSMNLKNGLIKRISIKELQLLYLRGNVAEFQRRNPSLSLADISLLGQLTQDFLVRGTRQQQLTRTLKELRDLSERMKTLPDTDAGVKEQMQEVYKTLTAKRAFVPHEHPEFLVFEYQANLLMRKNQVEGMQKHLAKDSNLIQQIIMGGGKSDILLVLLALKKADGNNVSIIMVPDELMKQVSDNVQMRSGEIFQQTAQRINWHDTSIAGLKGILDRLHKVRDNRDFLLMTSKDMHDFSLRAREHRLNCSETEGILDNDAKETLKLFLEIKQFLKKHGDVIIDEVDSVLHCRKEVHIALKEGSQILKQYIDITDVIYSVLLGDPNITEQISFDFEKPRLETTAQDNKVMKEQDIKSESFVKTIDHSHIVKATAITSEHRIKDSINLPPSTAASRPKVGKPFTLDLYKTIKKELSTKVLDKLKQSELLKPFGAYFKQIDEYIFTENDKQAKALPDELPLNVKNALAFLRSELHIFLPMSLNKRYDENYGLFMDKAFKEFRMMNPGFIPRAEELLIAGPFEGANTPKIGSQFGHYTEQVNYTRQSYAKGIPDHLVVKELERIKLAVTNEFLSSRLSNISEAESHQEYVDMCGESITKQHNLVQLDEAGMKEVSKKISANPELLQRFVGKYILPHIILHKYRISSNAQNLPEMFHRVQGFTGTLPNEDMFHDRFTTQAQEGIDGSILMQLAKNSLEEVYTVNENNPQIIFETMLKVKDAEKYKTLIDEGGLFKSMPNGELAQKILLARNDLEAIIYFENDKALILKRGQAPLSYNKSNDIDPSKRFTIYDQKHCRGTHVDQAHQAKGWVTTNRIDILSNVEQAIYRMRRIAGGQTVSLLIPEDLVCLTKLQADRKGKLDVMDLTITLSRTQARQIADDNLLSIQQKMHNLVMQICEDELDKVSHENTNKPIFRELNQILIKIIEDAPYQQYGQVEYPEIARTVLESYRDQSVKQLHDWLSKHSKDPLLPKIDTKLLYEGINRIIEKALVPKKEQVNATLPFHPKAAEDSAKGTQVQVAIRTQVAVQQTVDHERQTRKQMEVQQQLQLQLEQQLNLLKANAKADEHSSWLKTELMFSQQYHQPVQWSGSKVSTTQAASKSGQNCWLSVTEALALNYDKQLSADLFANSQIYAHIDLLFTRSTDLVPFGPLQKGFGPCLIVQDVNNPKQIELRPIDALSSEMFKKALLQDKSKPFAGKRDKNICLYDPEVGIYQQGCKSMNLDDLIKANPDFNRMVVQYKFLSAKIFGYTKEELILIKNWFSGMKQSPLEIEKFFKDALLKLPKSKAEYPNSQLGKFFAVLNKERMAGQAQAKQKAEE